jgi:hypothetical protein
MFLLFFGCFSKQTVEAADANEKILECVNLLDTIVGNTGLTISYREDSMLFIKYGELKYAEKLALDVKNLELKHQASIGVFSNDSILFFDGLIKTKQKIIFALKTLWGMEIPVVVYLKDNKIWGVDILSGGYFGGANDGMVLKNDSLLICEYRTSFDLSSNETLIRVFNLKKDTFSFIDTFVYIPKNKELLEKENYNELRSMQLIKKTENIDFN